MKCNSRLFGDENIFSVKTGWIMISQYCDVQIIFCLISGHAGFQRTYSSLV